jgi:hypothetical protein
VTDRIIVYNNPQGFIDPMGLCVKDKIANFFGPSLNDLLERLRRVGIFFSSMDLVPFGAIPVIGSAIGGFFDAAAGLTTQSLLIVDAILGNINLLQYVAASGLNIANVAVGAAGDFPFLFWANVGLTTVETSLVVATDYVTGPGSFLASNKNTVTKPMPPDRSSPLSNTVTRPINSNTLTRPMPLE